MSAALALDPRLIAANDSRRRAPAVVRRVHDRHHAPPAPSRVPVSVNGSTVGTYAYDPFRLTSLSRGNGVVTNYGYDPLWRLQTLATTLSGAGNTDNISLGFNYSMASQLKSRAMTTAQALYTYVPTTATTTYTINGLNQIASTNSVSSFSYDTRGNLTNDGTTTYVYNANN